MNLRFVNFFIIFTIFSQINPQPLDDDKIFDDYMKKFNIRIGKSANDVSNAKMNVISRYRTTKWHNEQFRNGSVKFEMELNKFSYLSGDELARRTLGVRNETSPYSEFGECSCF